MTAAVTEHPNDRSIDRANEEKKKRQVGVEDASDLLEDRSIAHKTQERQK